MRCALAYGSGKLDIELPPTAEVLVPRASTAYDEPTAPVEAALRAPVGTPPLSELGLGQRSACVVISDGTRPAAGPWVLPALLDTLRAADITDIDVLIATGSHRAARPDEIERLLGSGTATRVHSHDAAHGEHVHVGETRFGTAVWIDALYARADLRIVVGVVEPHLMAGYSGGPKNVCPGIARLDTIHGIHRATVARGRVGPGIVRDNPFRAEVFEAAQLAGVDFSVQCCVSRDQRLTFVSAGALEPSTERAVEHAMAHSLVSTAQAHDVVVVSGGGAPLDRTLYQAAKGWASGAAVVRAGGDLVLVAELRDGLGAPEFSHLLEAGLDKDATSSATPVEGHPEMSADNEHDAPVDDDHEAPVREGGSLHPIRTGQWMLQHILQARSRARLHIVSSQPPVRLRGMGLEAHATVPAALETLCGAGRTADVLVLPHGPYCVPTLGDRFVTLEGQVAF